MKNNQVTNSIEALSRALEININNDTAMRMLLELSYKEGRFSHIELALKRYLDVSPFNVNMLFGLAGVQYKTDCIVDAQNTLSRIFSLEPENNDAIELLNQIRIHEENKLEKQI